VARALDLSRIPVREAIIALEREGFVTTELHRGAFVSSLNEQEVQDQYELYGILHGFAAERALERSNSEFVKELRQIEQRLAATDDPALVGDLSFEFHRTVVRATNSPRISVVFRSLPGLRPSDFFAVVPGAMEAEKRGIKTVVGALERGDREKAARAYERMMGVIGDKVVELFRLRGLFVNDL
jgi:DNA-binding GntR family transcriptional regulator